MGDSVVRAVPDSGGKSGVLHSGRGIPGAKNEDPGEKSR